MEFPFLQPKAIEVAAEALLTAALGPRPRPLSIDLDAIIFDHLAEAEKLSFTDEYELGNENGERILGMMHPAKGRIQVCRTVKEHGPLGRYRFTVAHELGHWVLHRSTCLVQEGTLDLFDPREEITLVSLNRNVFPSGGGPVPREEWQANNFAAMLLIPAEELAFEFQERFGPPPFVAGHGRLAADLAADLATAIERGRYGPLAAAFGVSVQAMAIALTSRGYVTDQAVLL